MTAAVAPLSAHPSAPVTLLPSLDHLPTANMQLLAQRALLDRVDRKFVTNWDHVRKFLEGLGEAYHVLPTQGKTWARYETCYFDTDALEAFHEHVRGRRPRFKIRVRKHVERKRAFLEIKKKGADGRTEKHRLDRDYALGGLTDAERAFVASHAPFETSRLEPSVWTNFYRATLLGSETEERITIDLNLQFERNGEQKEQEDLAIIELKQRRLSNLTPAARRLQELHIRERSLSKYCAGVANLHEAARPQYRKLLLKRLSRLQKWKTY